MQLFDDFQTWLKTEKKGLKPEMNSEYWRIDEFGDIYSDIWRNSEADNDLFSIGNVFLTKELVQQELAKRKAIQKIKEYIANEGIELADPMKDSEWWSIHWDKNNEKFIIRYYDFVLHFSPIGYFKTNVDVKKVIKNFTPELKTIWGIK